MGAAVETDGNASTATIGTEADAVRRIYGVWTGWRPTGSFAETKLGDGQRNP